MTEVVAPPAEAVEIVRRSQCWYSQAHADGECCKVNRRCYTDATAALTALAAADPHTRLALIAYLMPPLPLTATAIMVQDEWNRPAPKP